MSAESELIFYVNGQWCEASEAKVSVLDRGLQYGDGVFEGIKVYNGKIFKLDEHLDRLFRSMHFAIIEPPMTREEFKRTSIEFVQKNKLLDGHFKILVTRGEGYLLPHLQSGGSPSKSSVMIFGIRLAASMYGSGEKGIRLKTTALRKIPAECLDPRIKSLNYMNSVLNRLEAEVSGKDEALLLDVSGFVAEGPGSNFFIVSDGTVIAPPECRGLGGITRSTVLELAKNAGYSVAEEDITLYDVYEADEAFMCGSAAEIMLVSEVDGRRIGTEAPITKKLRELFIQFAHRDGPWLTKAL